MIEQPDPTEDIAPSEREFAKRLTAARPVPSAGFRGSLRHDLLARDPGYGPRPERLRLMVAGYLAVGVLLMALAVVLAL